MSKREVARGKVENEELVDELTLFKKEAMEQHKKGLCKVVWQTRFLLSVLTWTSFIPSRT